MRAQSGTIDAKPDVAVDDHDIGHVSQFANEVQDRRKFATIKRAYKTLYRNGLSLEAARDALELASRDAPLLAPLVEFISGSARGIVR